MLANAWADFRDWSKQPFRADMTVQGWFAFIGLMLVILILWRIILNHVVEA